VLVSDTRDYELPGFYLRSSTVQEGEALYRAALASLGQGVIIQDADSTIVAANEAAPRILGLTMDQLLGRTSLDPDWRVVHRDGTPFPGEEHPVPVALREHRAVRDVVMGVFRPDGRVAWILVNVEPIVTAEGVDTGTVVCSYADITAQLETDDRYRLLAENATDVVVLVGADGVVQWISPSVLGTLGWEPQAVSGRPLLDLVHPDDQARVRSEQHRAMQERGDGPAESALEVRLRTRDGAWRWMAVSGRMLMDAAGQPLVDISSMRDVQRQVEARELMAAAQAELEEAYRLLAENSTGVVFRADTSGHVTWVSDSVGDLLGWAPSEVAGRLADDLTHPDDLAALRTLQERVSGGGSGTARLRFLQKDGGYRWVEARARPVTDATGAVVGRVGSWRDLEDEVAALEALARSEVVLRTAMRSAAIGMALTDEHGAFTVVNPSLSTMLGRDEQWLLEHRIGDILDREQEELAEQARAGLLDGLADKFEGTVRLQRADGQPLWARVAAVMIAGVPGHERSFMIQVLDITAEREAREQLSYQAFHDALTGLRNRAWILDMLETDLNAARRSSRTVGVLFIDLDNFKLVNDSLGHAAGDEVLARVADRIASTLRPTDHVGRFGGDEFVVVLPDVHNGPGIEKVAERISAAIATEITVQGHRIVPTASMGIALSSSTSTSASLLRDTDSALFRAKDAGRARWHLFDEAMHAQAVARLTLEDELRRAVAGREFVVHYQPIVRLADQAVVGHEALVRWQHPTRGLLAPGDFLEVAEESGLVVGLGRQLLDDVCARLAAEPSLPGPINVNVSAVELSARGWLDSVVGTVQRHDVDPRRLVVEVTETAVLSLLDGTHSDLLALRELGVGVQVDDFGTGFSSISLLRDLPVTGIKLDRSFVRDLTDEDSPANALAAGVAGLAQGLHLVGIAEGVETAAQLRVLLDQGWTHGQGFLFARPGPDPHPGPTLPAGS
jgi:diguanylate cyclase (GGDEF)-like protein/PAS domain S-box-containing protein